MWTYEDLASSLSRFFINKVEIFIWPRSNLSSVSFSSRSSCFSHRKAKNKWCFVNFFRHYHKLFSWVMCWLALLLLLISSMHFIVIYNLNPHDADIIISSLPRTCSHSFGIYAHGSYTFMVPLTYTFSSFSRECCQSAGAENSTVMEHWQHHSINIWLDKTILYIKILLYIWSYFKIHLYCYRKDKCNKSVNGDWWIYLDACFCSSTIEQFATTVSSLAQTLADILAEKMGHKSTFFKENCLANTCYLRLNRYPPCPTAFGIHGLMPHTDSDFLTILYQDQVGGLQLVKDTKWIAVKPNPDALIINIGDLFQVFTFSLIFIYFIHIIRLN